MPTKFVAGLLAGLGLGVFVGGLAAGVIASARVKGAEAEARKGWMLAPVVVYAENFAAGDVTTFDGISQRSVPEKVITTSVVKPDSAKYIVNQRVAVPVVAGEVALWTHFDISEAQLKQRTAYEACAHHVRFGVRPLTTPDQLRALVESAP